ncbi:hypothetical protein NKI61_29970 [Mesorhizobium sp. M0514]|uniref:hypothetical protein n=1 Tax=Mesorhizobium sp. M0514 TaxID=2956955 RepID=UPI003339181A
MKDAAELIAETLTTEELLKTREWCTSREAQKPWYGEYGDSPKMLTKCAIMVVLIDEAIAGRAAADQIETLEARVATLSADDAAHDLIMRSVGLAMEIQFYDHGFDEKTKLKFWALRDDMRQWLVDQANAALAAREASR